MIYLGSSYTFHSRNFKDSFSAKKKAGAVFVDLTATNDTHLQNYRDRFQADTWWTLSWSLYAIVATSSLQLALDSKANYDA